MDDPEAEGRAILSRMDELHFRSHKAGLFAELDLRMAERLEAGESVTGPWLMETLKSLQVQYGLVPV